MQLAHGHYYKHKIHTCIYIFIYTYTCMVCLCICVYTDYIFTTTVCDDVCRCRRLSAHSCAPFACAYEWAWLARKRRRLRFILFYFFVSAADTGEGDARARLLCVRLKRSTGFFGSIPYERDSSHISAYTTIHTPPPTPHTIITYAEDSGIPFYLHRYSRYRWWQFCQPEQWRRRQFFFT